MTRTAEGAPVETPSSLDESLETGFLSDDPHYRLTGEFKPEKEEAPAASKETTETKPGTEEVSATSTDDEQDASKAAASATAETQKTERDQREQTRTRENRWQKRERELRELREKVARLEGAQSTTQRSESQQTSQAAAEVKAAPDANARPKIDDVDPKTGKAKFANYGEYEDARDAWNRQQAIREFQETSQKTERERQLEQSERVIANEWNKRVTEVAKKYPDYAEVCFPTDDKGGQLLHIPQGSVPDVFFLKSEHGPEVLYHAAKDHPEIFATREVKDAKGNPALVYVMDAWDQARELLKVEMEVSGAATSRTSSARTVTQAHRPPNQVSGKGTVAKDAVEQAVEDGDTETYIRAQNAKDLARQKRK